jgi:tetratricopeptide (TPR) repeat protein
MGCFVIRHATRGGRSKATLGLALLTVIAFLAVPAPVSAGLAETAIARCHRVELTDETDRPAAIDYALALADAALESDPLDAHSHYAVFCVLAKRVRYSGVRLRMFSDLRRMRKHIDQALVLQPDYSEAIAAKGVYLYYLPRLLGGNTKLGIELLTRSLELDPSNAATRLLFADVLADLGQHEASVRQSQHAAELLRSDDNESHRAAACAVFDSCVDKRWPKEALLAVSGAC